MVAFERVNKLDVGQSRNEWSNQNRQVDMHAHRTTYKHTQSYKGKALNKLGNGNDRRYNANPKRT